jgi:hypothetical protein
MAINEFRERNLSAEFPVIPEDYLPENVHVHFFFGPHAHEDHALEQAEALEQADIFIPESSGWIPEVESMLQRVAKANYSEGQRLIGKFALAMQHDPRSLRAYTHQQLKQMRGKRKLVLLIDSTAEEELAAGFGDFTPSFISSDFETEIEKQRQALGEIRG